MKITALRLILLAAIIVAGWLISGAVGKAGDAGAMLLIGAVSSMAAAAVLGYWIVMDYREREARREKDAEERLRKEMDNLK